MSFDKQPIIKLINKGWDFFLDLLFPKHCVGCRIEGKWICDNCQKKIILIQKPTCPHCNRLTKNGQLCSKCRKDSNLTGVFVAAYYKDGPLKEAIHTFKYEGVFDLANDLANFIDNNPNLKTFTKCNKVRIVLIPVPLHKKRKAIRGFNQAELLACQIAQKNNLDLVKNKLIRHKYQKKNQAELSGNARRENLKDCFSWIGKKDELTDKIVLLVDDVYTTGSTLEECAKVLRQNAGAKKIWGIVLAKV